MMSRYSEGIWVERMDTGTVASRSVMRRYGGSLLPSAGMRWHLTPVVPPMLPSAAGSRGAAAAAVCLSNVLA